MVFTTAQKRITLLVSIFASFIGSLDGFVVNVALPAIERDLGGGFATQQWIVNAYMVSLSALMLIAGSLSDTLGRKRMMQIGLIGFGITSLLCAIAPTAEILIIARALQGAAGAILVPSSLALIMTVFSGKEEGKAIGSWTAWTVIAPAVGPLIGGFLVDSLSWRAIFWINIIPIIVTYFLLHRLELNEKNERAKVDYIGTVLCSLGLLGIVYAFTEESHFGWQSAAIQLPLIAGVILIGLFIWYERRASAPMLPLSLFKQRNFSVGNISTTAIYGALAASTFLLGLFLQQIAHYSALAAGLAFLPVTILMFALSRFFGNLSSKFGPRLFMTIGPLIMATAFLSFIYLGENVNYLTQLLPGILVFGLGLSITVAPLTSAILGAIDVRRSGIASAVNNAVSRIAGLITIAFLGVLVGSQLTPAGFYAGMVFTACLMAVGGIVSGFGIQNDASHHPS